MRPSDKKNLITIAAASAAALIALAVAGKLWLDTRYPATPPPATPHTATHATPPSKKATPAKPAPAKPARPIPAEPTPEEKETLARLEQTTAPLQAALDADNKADTLAQARALMSHPDPAVREKVVEALAWMEMAGFPDLCRMLLDPSEEVASAAQSAWSLQMGTLENKKMKTEMAQVAAEAALDKNLEFFEEVMGTLHDIDEPQAVAMLQSLLDRSQEPEFIEKIIDELTFITQPDDPIEKKADVQKAIDQWQQRLAREAAEEAAAQQ